MTIDQSVSWFISTITPLQREMLLLEREKARYGFNDFFKAAYEMFNTLQDSHNKFRRGEAGYIIKKQIELILRYLDELAAENLMLGEKSERDIIHLFEKQYKLKKIVLNLNKESIK